MSDVPNHDAQQGADDDDEWVLDRDVGGVAQYIQRRKLREREEEENGERPKRKRNVRGRNFMTY